MIEIAPTATPAPNAHSKTAPASFGEPAGPDRRRSSRRPASSAGELVPGTACRLVNVGLGGVAITTEWALRVGGTYRLRWAKGETEGEVRWSRLTATRRGQGGDVVPIFVSGIRFGAN